MQKTANHESCAIFDNIVKLPCAAIVCERVGKSFVMTAVLKPSATKPKAALKPAPPTNSKYHCIFFLSKEPKQC